MATTPLPNFHAIIPAGGSGSRLWPLSRADQPKFLHDLTGNGHTLLRNTWDRLVPLAGAENVTVVTGVGHARHVESQLPELKPDNLLREPSPRESTAAIGFAAAVISLRTPDAIVGSFAADHVITDTDAFHRCVAEAYTVARAGETLVTIGMRPSEPSSAFGYVEAAEAISVTDAPSAKKAARFVEKPDWATATQYVEAGTFLWNAGMFIARAAVILDLIEQYSVELASNLRALAEGFVAGHPDIDPEAWAGLEKIAFDYAVAEPAAERGVMAVIPGEFGWDDIGDFAALARLHATVGDLAVLGKNTKVLTDAASGIVVSQTDRLVSLIGVTDIVVVDTPDALLVTTKENAQRVKALVDMLRLGGDEDVL
jgi:mannose-1-phosphate guanylyltransferase